MLESDRAPMVGTRSSLLGRVAIDSSCDADGATGSNTRLRTAVARNGAAPASRAGETLHEATTRQLPPRAAEGSRQAPKSPRRVDGSRAYLRRLFLTRSERHHRGEATLALRAGCWALTWSEDSLSTLGGVRRRPSARNDVCWPRVRPKFCVLEKRLTETRAPRRRVVGRFGNDVSANRVGARVRVVAKGA